MAIEIIKPIWSNDIDAYVATIGGKKYIIDIEKSFSSKKVAKTEKSEKSVAKKGGRALRPSTELIKSGATFEEVVAKFPEYKKSNYDQTRNRLGLTNKQKKASSTKSTDKASSTPAERAAKAPSKKKAGTNKSKKSSSKASKVPSKPDSHSTEHASTPVE